MSSKFIENALSLHQSLTVIIGDKGALNCDLKGNHRLKSRLNLENLKKNFRTFRL